MTTTQLPQNHYIVKAIANFIGRRIVEDTYDDDYDDHLERIGSNLYNYADYYSIHTSDQIFQENPKAIEFIQQATKAFDRYQSKVDYDDLIHIAFAYIICKGFFEYRIGDWEYYDEVYAAARHLFEVGIVTEEEYQNGLAQTHDYLCVELNDDAQDELLDLLINLGVITEEERTITYVGLA